MFEKRVEEDSNSARSGRGRIEVLILCAAVALLGLGCLLILRPFISAALWAGILCFTTWPVFLRLEKTVGGRSGTAALIATFALAAILAAPVVILGSTLASNLADLTAATRTLYEMGPPAPPEWVAHIPLVGRRVSDYWMMLTQSSSARLEGLTKLLPTVKTVAVAGGAILGSGVLQIFLSLFIAFFFYRDGKTFAAELNAGVFRVGGNHGSELLELAGNTVRAVVYGIIGTALVQGALAAFGFLIAGVPGAAFLGFVTFMLSMVPGGPLLVALPAAYWIYTRGSSSWAIFMIIWGVMVGSIDNVIKPLLIGRGVPIPMVLVMLGVLGGAIAFGLIGLFIGPTLLAIGYTLYKEWASVVAITTQPRHAAPPQPQPAAMAVVE